MNISGIQYLKHFPKMNNMNISGIHYLKHFPKLNIYVFSIRHMYFWSNFTIRDSTDLHTRWIAQLELLLLLLDFLNHGDQSQYES